MFKKWCFGILATVLALLVIVQQHAIVSNQEIVLEFVDIEIDSPEAQNAITTVKKQLQALGVKETQIITSFKNGKLKITYYSDTDIAQIKSTLTATQNSVLNIVVENKNTPDTPKEKEEEGTQDYKLNIYEIQQSADFSADYLISHVVKVKKTDEQADTKFDTDQTTNINGTLPATTLENRVKVALKANTDRVLAIHTSSQLIPEVRAGPLS